jgi:hypothetical protein
VAVKEA